MTIKERSTLVPHGNNGETKVGKILDEAVLAVKKHLAMLEPPDSTIRALGEFNREGKAEMPLVSLGSRRDLL